MLVGIGIGTLIQRRRRPSVLATTTSSEPTLAARAVDNPAYGLSGLDGHPDGYLEVA